MKPAVIVLALVLLSLAAYDYFYFSKPAEQATPWLNPIITKNEFKAMDWIRNNTMERQVFMADIFGGEFIMGSTLREATEGGDWAIVPNVIERMNDVQYHFYGAKNAQEAWQTAKKYNATYAWLPDRQVFAGYEWKSIDYAMFENSTLFEKVYDDGVKIFLVNKP